MEGGAGYIGRRSMWAMVMTGAASGTLGIIITVAPRYYFVIINLGKAAGVGGSLAINLVKAGGFLINLAKTTPLCLLT